MGVTASELAARLPRLAPEHTFVFFLPEETEPPVSGDNVEIVRVPFPRVRFGLFVAEQIHLARLAERQNLDVLHSIAYAPPILYEGRKILTIHDLGFRIIPESAPWRFRLYWNWAYGTAARRCNHLIAVSRWTREDAIREMNLAPEKISVVHNGVDERFAPPPPGHNPRITLDRLGLPPRYILNVGTLQPRKDLVTLFETFARIRKRYADLRLVVCGGRGWGYSDPREHTRRLGIDEDVVFLGYASQDMMPDLYRGAELFLFTSRYEGFGLPLIEAMSCGTPVVATDVSAIPEITDGAALLAPAKDDKRLSDHCLNLMDNPDLAEKMITKGLERSAAFSWESAARRTSEVYGAFARKDVS